MKLRRGIAKLLAAVVIVELVLSSFNQNQYTVMAATEEGTQSEQITESATEESTESTQETSGEMVESTEETGGETLESTEEKDTESQTEAVTESTADQNLESGTEEVSEADSEQTTENATEENSENTTKDVTKQATGEISDSISESTQEEVQDGLAAAGNYSIQLLTDDSEDKYSIPDEVSELDKNTLYSISTYQDWINLQTLSKQDSLSGYRFVIYEQTLASGQTVPYYELANLEGFEGLGTKEFPFQGTLYATSLTGVRLETKKPLFQYLSTKASLDNLLLAADGACAGLADNLIVESEFFEKLNEVIISESGEITGDVAGGLFANVIYGQNYTGTFKLQGTGVKVNAAVSGKIAGGLIGTVTGGINLVMDGGIQWPSSVEALDTGSTIGGWIGTIDANTGNVVISSGDSQEIIYTFQKSPSGEAEITGGLFGNIEDAEVNIENNLTINKTGSGYDLVGLTAGSFAGVINNTTINLNASVKVEQIKIKHIALPSEYKKNYGIGGFVGVATNFSKIDSLKTTGNIDITGVSVAKKTTSRHNIGGLTGYAHNSYFLFTNAKCTVTDFSSANTSGQVAGAIGLYEADENMGKSEETVVIQRISVTGATRADALSGNAAGLIGKMNLTDCTVTVQNCSGGDLCYAGGKSASETNASLGIGKVDSLKSSAKLCLNGIVLVGKLTQSSTTTQNENFGGMIGWLDCDLEIAGKVEGEVFDTAVSYAFSDKEKTANFFGGLIGTICQSGTEYRKVDISNVLVGSQYYSVGNKYAVIRGGLIGKVEDRTSVCLDGMIHMNGGSASRWDEATTESPITISREITNQGTTEMGSVVGSQNYSLIYIQPTGELKLPDNDRSNEIGNYGGIIRNGNWDQGELDANGKWIPSDNNQNKENWLIQDHEVQGSWKFIGEDSSKKYGISWDNNDNSLYDVWKLQINTIGDFMRLAILGNTYNITEGTSTEYKKGDGFYPTGVVNEETGESDFSTWSRTKVCESVLMADFYLDAGTYDLTETGIVSLYRNDMQGVNGTKDNENITRNATGWAQNSLICEDDNRATIIYKIIDYSQLNIGLFPAVSGEKKKVEFKNLNLQYTYNGEVIKYGNGQGSIEKLNSQYVGGLAAKARYEINVSNVKYIGSRNDNRTYQKGSPFQYTGGLFGYYAGTERKKLTIDNLDSEFTCSYADRNNTVGGVIAWVQTTDYYRCNAQMENISISGNITAKFTANNVEIMQSGLITKITSENTQDIYSNFDISNVSIDNFTLKATDTTYSHTATGGFLGYTWNCVKANLNNIQIGTTEAAAISAKTQSFGGLVHDIRGKVLIKGMTYGPNTSFDICDDANAENCGLLVQNGQYLYLDVANYSINDGVTLKNYSGKHFDELVGYNKGGDSADRGGLLSISTGDDTSYLGKNPSSYNSYGYGYHVKDESGLYIQKQNPNTRYYYDLDELNFGVDYQKIESANDLMVWHIMHYANNYIVNECFVAEQAKYTYDKIPISYTISGNIDMTGYSIYPTSLWRHESYTAAGETKITFNAKSIYDGENELQQNQNYFVTKYPEDTLSQHYQMHAGLFYNIWDGVDVTGLTLSGTYSISDEGTGNYTAGALVCGTIYGVALQNTGSQGETLYDEDVKSNFNDITLSNLWCVSNEGKLTEDGNINLYNPIGLMIAIITSGAKINMDGIYMKEYGDEEVANGYEAASALIGQVGDEEATYISLSFKNMDIMDAAEGKTSEQLAELNATKCEEALARASFIYSYNYKENCSAIYTFTSKDYLVGKLKVDRAGYDNYEDDGVVTLGIELGNQSYTYDDGSVKNYAEILYYDNDDQVGMASQWLMEDGTLKDTGASEIIFDCNNYIPYVWSTERDILVNPKIAHIEKGCGTYEDPYIISTTTQLITVYRYLYEEELYKDVLGMSGNEWKIHALGDDSSICNGTEDDTDDGRTGHGKLLSYERERSEGSDFPTQEELSRAYYMITDDIDLSKYTEFIGFGREEMPFIGVLVGQVKLDGEEVKVPMITMLDAPNSTLSQYAFIQAAKGAVIKDLSFSFGSTVNIDSETGGIGAGVIATVLGGDNIIDGVTVQSAADNACFSVKKETAVVGGYVGVVELGGIILRNMPELGLADFSVSVATDTVSSAYPYLGSIIGRVLDGYVIYDENYNEEISLLKDCEIVSDLVSAELPLCSTYDIINGVYLESEDSENDSDDSKIQWTESGFKIANGKQLQIISMALNSGMLNYGAKNSNGDTYGYGSDSRQRRGNYNYVAQDIVNDSAALAAYEDVIKAGDNTDTFTGSYLWKYFEDSSSSKNMLDAANSSGLNPTTVDKDTILTYELTGEYYDMSVFEMAFRGLGARYHCTKYTDTNQVRLSDTTLLFKSNLKGTASESALINLEMIVTEEMDSPRAGLLNEVPNLGTGNNCELLIQNITLSGKVYNQGLDVVSNGSYYTQNVLYHAGGFMSSAVNKVKFKQVNLNEITVDATGYAGGLIGNMRQTGDADFTAQEITLDGLEVVGGCDSKAEKIIEEGIAEGHAGGLIGKLQSFSKEAGNIYIGIKNPDDVEQEGENNGVKGDQVTVFTRGRGSSVGGIIGVMDLFYYNKLYLHNSTMTNLTVYSKNAYYTSTWTENMASVGGIIGYSTRSNIELNNIVIGSTEEGCNVNISKKEENIKSSGTITVWYLDNYTGVGGFIGRYYPNGFSTMEISSCKIQGNPESENTVIESYGTVGGMIGLSQKASIKDSVVQGVTLKSAYRLGGCIGMFEMNGESPELNKVSVIESELSLTNPEKNSRRFANAPGEIGGLVGSITGDATLEVCITGCKVADSVIAPDYSRVAGGFVGNAAQKVSVSENNADSNNVVENEVTNNLICGDIAGGVFGTYTAGSESTGISNLIISNNKIISYIYNNPASYRINLAGGFAGKIETSATLGPIEAVEIRGNLLAGVDPDNVTAIGGVVGTSNANTFFYDTKLKDNYIGLFEDGEFLTEAENAWSATDVVDNSVIISNYLTNTSIDELKTKLYAKTMVRPADNALKRVSELQNLPEEELYLYSYGIGAVAGTLTSSTSRKNTFVGINIYYEDNTYRPASDVGMIAIPLTTTDMYERYRAQYYIVYDSMNVEQKTTDSKYSGFSNLELIYDTYQDENKDRRYAYKLNDNYMTGTYSNNTSVSNVYEGTYMKDGEYVSDFKDGQDNTLPLVVFRTSDEESLDDVLQTYINILTNNSGALNSYDHQTIEVTTTRKLLVNGSIVDGSMTDDSEEIAATVQATKQENSNNKYTFVNTAADGTRLYDSMTDEKNITFTVITIAYQYGGETKWELKIPVYVEQELEVDSHMRFVKGLEYDVSVVKKGFYTPAGSESSYSLDIGESYTVYLEYVYGEARIRYADAIIPKQLQMQSANKEKSIYFLQGTQLTLIDMGNGGKPYYYTVEGTEENAIDFTKFVASNDVDSYTTKEIGMCKEYKDTAYVDVCGETMDNVAVENYLLLVDTSQVDNSIKENRRDATYSIHTDISELREINSRLYNRIEYVEHCFVSLNEKPGFECEFVDEQCEVEGEIVEGGSIAFTIEYSTIIYDVWKKANAGNPVYLDIAVALQKTVGDTSQSVSLPVGTQIYFETTNANGELERYKQPYVIQGNGISDVYFYGDSGLDPIDITKFVSDQLWTKKVRIVLDFSMADMSAFVNKAEYFLAADLLIGTDKDNPGNGEIRDSIQEWVDVNIVTELGFALQTVDLLYQGINCYQSGDTDTGIIPFKAKIAFPDDYGNEDIKGKYYTFIYKIEEKSERQNGIIAPQYELYKGDKIRLYFGANTSEMSNNTNLTTVAGAEGTYYYCYLSYEQNQLTVTENIAEASFILEAGDGLDYSNYRVTGYVIISDSPIGANEIEESITNTDLNSDFFVYTIAKVKTDLNIDLTTAQN